VRIEVYPNSTLYKDKEERDALQAGAVPMLAPFSDVYPAIHAIDCKSCHVSASF